MGAEQAARHSWPTARRGECRSDALRAIEKLGPGASRLVRAGSLAYVGEALGWPEWLTRGTNLEPGTPIPAQIPLSDDLLALANLYDHADPFHFAVQIMRMPLAGMSATTALGFQVAPTLNDALKVRASLHTLSSPQIAIQYFREGDRGGIRIKSDCIDGRLFQCYAVALLGIFHALSKSVTPLLDRAARIEASISGSHQSLFAAEVGCPTVFGAAEDRLIIGAEALDQPNPRFDPELWNVVVTRLAAEPSRIVETPSRNVLARIRLHLDQRRVPRLKQIADELGQSERTIVRLLNAEGTSYRLLVDAERRARAVELLADRQIDLAQVSELLGFTDRPSFWRTFRRWFGVTPSQYRRD